MKPEEIRRLVSLMDRAKRGDVEAQKEVRKMFSESACQECGEVHNPECNPNTIGPRVVRKKSKSGLSCCG